MHRRLHRGVWGTQNEAICSNERRGGGLGGEDADAGAGAGGAGGGEGVEEGGGVGVVVGGRGGEGTTAAMAAASAAANDNGVDDCGPTTAGTRAPALRGERDLARRGERARAEEGDLRSSAAAGGAAEEGLTERAASDWDMDELVPAPGGGGAADEADVVMRFDGTWSAHAHKRKQGREGSRRVSLELYEGGRRASIGLLRGRRRGGTDRGPSTRPTGTGRARPGRCRSRGAGTSWCRPWAQSRVSSGTASEGWGEGELEGGREGGRGTHSAGSIAPRRLAG